jgi:hypothetical protein
MKTMLIALALSMVACGRAEDAEKKSAPTTAPTAKVQDPAWTQDRIELLVATCQVEVDNQIAIFWTEKPAADFSLKYCACLYVALRDMVTVKDFAYAPLKWHGELSKRGFELSCRDEALKAE